MYALADIAFVGGSLVPTGGHNILEPAQYGAAIVVGPHTFNFREIVSIFEQGDAIRVVTAATLSSQFLALLQQPEDRKRPRPPCKRAVCAACRSHAPDAGSSCSAAGWAKARWPMNPLSTIFGAGVAIRNALYDRGIFRVRKLARPVISVGNISVGGSGKTPFVIALGELLKQRGIAFDVLSRGYRRNSIEIAVVDPNGSPAQFGDEPLLIARKLQVPVIVGADRYRAGLVAEKQFSSKLHLLDDGFQHRRLHRDFDIVLLPAEDHGGILLPVGRLREPIAALRRADAVVLPEALERSINAKRVWPARRVVELSETGGRLDGVLRHRTPNAVF